MKVTASIFGKVLERRQTIYPVSIIRSVAEKGIVRKSSMSPAMEWLIEHKNDAAERYLAMFRLPVVKKYGFIINSQWPSPGCGPDGIVFENGMEIS